MATTKTKEEIKQFVLDTLLPYKKDPSNCALSEGLCVYLADNGNKCAVGKHLKPNTTVQSFVGDIHDLTSVHPLSDILTDEAKDYEFDVYIWKYMQEYHDGIGVEYAYEIINETVKKLESALDVDLTELKL